MPCPWYKNGMCTSPVFREPTPDPVVHTVCLGSESVYRGCRYFRERESDLSRFGKPLLLIHSLEGEMKSDCEFYVLGKHETGSYLAACEILGRLLTRYEVRLCVNYWRNCPYRKIGLRLTEPAKA